jgi:phage/plasmid-like protein (TIGR03299 family)
MADIISLPRIASWASIGTTIDSTAVDDALTKAKLNYEVQKERLYLADGTSIPEMVATTYTTTNTKGEVTKHILGTVGEKYEVVQNRDGFAFVDYISDGLKFVKGGMTHTGMIYLIAELPEVDILGDVFKPYVIFRNSFNGKYQLSAAITPLRVVCQNQFNFAFKHVENTINIRHSARAYDRMEEAKYVLQGVAQYMGKLNEIAKQFAGIKLNKTETEIAVNMLFPTPNNADERAKLVLASQKASFVKMLDADDNQNHKGNAWGLVNAYTDYITHTSIRKGRYEDSQFMNTCFKPMNNILDIVGQLKSVKVA